MKTKEYITPECFAVLCLENRSSILVGSQEAAIEDYLIDENDVGWL